MKVIKCNKMKLHAMQGSAGIEPAIRDYDPTYRSKDEFADQLVLS